LKLFQGCFSVVKRFCSSSKEEQALGATVLRVALLPSTISLSSLVHAAQIFFGLRPVFHAHHLFWHSCLPLLINEVLLAYLAAWCSRRNADASMDQ
jgi:hypothetical protein